MKWNLMEQNQMKENQIKKNQINNRRNADNQLKENSAENEKNPKKRVLSWILFLFETIAGAVAALAAAIALPIYCRPFYALEIKRLQIERTSGYDRDTIWEAYNQLMDYLLKGREFSTGALHYSQSGKSHFEDCKVLFDLDRNVLLISLAILVVCVLIHKIGKVSSLRIKERFGSSFFAGILAILFPAGFAVYCLSDFDSAFILFHRIFFPGKTNWLFDPVEDEIINVLPETFFADCAALIGAALLIICCLMIAAGTRKPRNTGKLKNTWNPENSSKKEK